MYPRPRKHRLCIHTPACLGYALEPYALREQHEDRAMGPRSRQEPPRSHSRIPAGVSLSVLQAACLRAAQTPMGRLDATHGPGWRLISAAAAAPDLRTQLQPVRPAAARCAGYSYMYTYTDGLKHGYKVFV